MTAVDDTRGRGIRDAIPGITDAIPGAFDVQHERLQLRGTSLNIFGVVLLLAAAAYGFYEWRGDPAVVSTEDAYVGAVLAQVTPQIDGIIGTVLVHDTQFVHKGDVLVSLDPKDAQLDYDAADAAYQQALRRVRTQFADTSAAQANVSAKRALVLQAQAQLQRRVRASGAITAEEISNARSAMQAAKYTLSMAEQELAAKKAIADTTSTDSSPEILVAKTNLEKARLRVQRTEIRSPVDGIVAQSHVQIGQQVGAGSELMTVVPIRQLYVDANFKESEVAHIRPGQLATLTSDIYGSKRIFHGYVEGVGGGTGAAFAVIPAQNATGNWIKVVQRLPVRIALDPKELADNPIRVGISMSVDVHLDRYLRSPQRSKVVVSVPDNVTHVKIGLRPQPSGSY